MQLLILSFVGIGIIVTAMAVGVLMGRQPISGSCGGMAAIGLDGECDICGGDPSKCDEENTAVKKISAANAANGNTTAYYEASPSSSKR